MHNRPGTRSGSEASIRRRLAPIIGLTFALAACATGTPSASESAGPSPTAQPSMTAFSSSTFDIPLSLTLVDDWKLDGDYQGDIDLQRGDQDAGISSIASMTVPGSAGGDPRMPWPNDLHAWLDSRPEFTPMAPRNITVGGRPAILIDADVSVPAGTKIDMICVASRTCWLVDHNDRWRFIEVRNADGSGIVVISPMVPDNFDSWAQALDELVATIAFR